MSNLLHRIRHGSLADGLALLPSGMTSLKAVAQVLKTGLQESRFEHRRQMVGSPPRPIGPAVSFYQFEKGGIRGVLRHPKTKQHVLALCDHFGIQPNELQIWMAMQTNDALGAAMARLNYYWVPSAMPAIDDEEGSWQYYLNTWRPGAFKRDPDGLRAKWARNHTAVLEYLRDPA